MIEFTKSYKTADGQVFGSIEDAQSHEIKCLLTGVLSDSEGGATLLNDISKYILEKKVVLIDILTTTPNSKPKARTTHGGTKNRKKTVITDAVTPATSTNNIPTVA